MSRKDPRFVFVLPTDSEERKQIPLFSGFLNYFPLACAAVARVSKRGNDKHNPGQPLHWSRGKSNDHADCIARHLIDVETLNAAGEYEDAAALAWRALALLQELEEKRLGAEPSRGSKVNTLEDVHGYLAGFKTAGAETGRTQSAEPNAAQPPRGESLPEEEVWGVWVTRFGKVQEWAGATSKWPVDRATAERAAAEYNAASAPQHLHVYEVRRFDGC